MGVSENGERFCARPAPEWVDQTGRVVKDCRAELVEGIDELRVRRSAGECTDELGVDREVDADHAIIGEDDLGHFQFTGHRGAQRGEEERAGSLAAVGGVRPLAVDPEARVRQGDLREPGTQQVHQPLLACRQGRRGPMADDQRLATVDAHRFHGGAQTVGATREEDHRVRCPWSLRASKFRHCCTTPRCARLK